MDVFQVLDFLLPRYLRVPAQLCSTNLELNNGHSVKWARDFGMPDFLC
jgi:hypothetical protein